MLLGYIALKEVVSGVIGGAIATLAMFGLNWLKDRSLAKHKEELGRESERLKNDMAQSGGQTLERLKADLGRETETHKLALKKLELLFDRQIEAASEFMTLRRAIDPKKAHPDEEWDEAQEKLASDLHKHELAMEAFLTKHGPIMSDDARMALTGCVAGAGLRRFDYEPGGDIGKELSDFIDSLLHELAGIELLLLRQVQA